MESWSLWLSFGRRKITKARETNPRKISETNTEEPAIKSASVMPKGRRESLELGSAIFMRPSSAIILFDYQSKFNLGLKGNFWAGGMGNSPWLFNVAETSKSTQHINPSKNPGRCIRKVDYATMSGLRIDRKLQLGKFLEWCLIFQKAFWSGRSKSIFNFPCQEICEPYVRMFFALSSFFTLPPTQTTLNGEKEIKQHYSFNQGQTSSVVGEILYDVNWMDVQSSIQLCLPCFLTKFESFPIKS